MSSSSVHRRKLSDESSGEFEEDNVGDDLADDDIDFVTSSERDRLLELLRFFATLFEMERTTPAAAEGRPSLAHLLLLREHDGDDEAANVGLTRAEKRHVTRVEKLATLLVRCFRCLEYLPHSNDSSGDDPDLLTPASARLVSYTQQMFHALNALVDDDDELRPVVSHAALTAFNFLPTIHTRVLFVESLRHRAQKLRWLDTMVTNNFLATGIQNKNRVRMEAPTVRKFVLVYMHLKYSKKDETAALRSLDLYVLLLMHIAHELVHVVRDDRARGVPSTVLQPIESYGTVHMGTSSNGSNGSNSGVVGSEEKVWLADLRSEILQQTEEERPNMTDAALFRLQLLEHALDELALAQSLQQ